MRAPASQRCSDKARKPDQKDEFHRKHGYEPGNACTQHFADADLPRPLVGIERRKTEIPDSTPDALSDAFAGDAAKQQQWKSFVEGIEAKSVELATIIADLAAFLMPHAAAARKLQ